MRNKKTARINESLDCSTDSKVTIEGRSATNYPGAVIRKFARKPRLNKLLQTLTSLASMIFVITGPTILVCAASKSFETLGLMLMGYLVGAVTGAAKFGFRVRKFRSHILIAPKNNNPDDVQMPKAA